VRSFIFDPGQYLAMPSAAPASYNAIAPVYHVSIETCYFSNGNRLVFQTRSMKKEPFRSSLFQFESGCLRRLNSGEIKSIGRFPPQISSDPAVSSGGIATPKGNVLDFIVDVLFLEVKTLVLSRPSDQTRLAACSRGNDNGRSGLFPSQRPK
jgi:hypothetical protein